MQWEYCSYMVEPGRDQRIATEFVEDVLVRYTITPK